MSRCRCEDIDEITEKIHKLKASYSRKTSYYQNRQVTEESLADMAHRALELTEAERVEASYVDVVRLRTKVDTSADRIYQKIQKKKDELEDKRNDMQHEDKEYHRRKKHED